MFVFGTFNSYCKQITQRNTNANRGRISINVLYGPVELLAAAVDNGAHVIFA